jgi:hypothetical protein
MARIDLSPLVSDVRGKVGDTVFSKWKGTNYIRTRVTPANPNTTAQQNVRDAMARLVSIWQELDADLKAAWDVWGATLQISGFNGFVKKNMTNNIAQGRMYWIAPPNADEPGFDTWSAASTTAGQLDLTWTGPTVTTNKKMITAIIYDNGDTIIAASKSVDASTGSGSFAGLTTGETLVAGGAVLDTVTGAVSTPTNSSPVTIA